jgi:hypothetical protein
MKMFIVLKSYRYFEKLNGWHYYKQIIYRLKELGIEVSKLEDLSNINQALFLVVNFPLGPDNKTPLKQITVWTSSQLMLGYCFISNYPNKRHLTLKTFLDNFDRLVIQQDHVLLHDLYSMEYELGDLDLH